VRPDDTGCAKAAVLASRRPAQIAVRFFMLCSLRIKKRSVRQYKRCDRDGVPINLWKDSFTNGVNNNFAT
jgi:hypothetical protein